MLFLCTLDWVRTEGTLNGNNGMRSYGKQSISRLSEIMIWQATSDRSGLWTYYEALKCLGFLSYKCL